MLQKFFSNLIFMFFITFSAIMLCSCLFVKNNSLADDNSSPKSTKVYSNSESSDATNQINKFNNEFKGVWFSYMDWNILTKSCVLNGKVDQEKFKKETEQVCKNLNSININNLFLHVRAFGDAFYPSDFAPQSIYLNNVNFDEFDPLKIFIDSAKKYKIKVHGWINPMRVFRNGKDKKNNAENVPDKYEIKQWFLDENKKNEHFAGTDSNDCWILNPCNENVIELIEKIVEELLQKYDLDGIHFDDYFFPVEIKKNAFDLKYFEKIKQNKNDENSEYFNKIKNDKKYYNQIKIALNSDASIEKFRFLATSHLIERIKLKCHKNKPESVFGVAVIGNFKVNSNLFIDIYDWIENGYIDYLMPEIYYSFENKIMPFNKCVDEWNEIVKKYKQKLNENKVKIYVGLAAYRIGNENYSDEGFHKTSDILKKQELYCRHHLENYGGYCFFDYNTIFPNSQEKTFKNELCKKNIVNLNKITNSD